jgi:hypothetical protein
MLPRLQALSEELCDLSPILAMSPGQKISLLTSEVSSPGIASASDVLVNERVGSSLVADCGALMLAVFCSLGARM